MIVEKVTKTTNFLIIDDHPIFIQGLTMYLNSHSDFTIVGNAQNRHECYEKIEQLNPDFITVDVSLKTTNGISLVTSIRKDYPNLKILMLSMHDEKTYAEKALRAGANGYIMKNENPGQILFAIRSIIDGQYYLSSKMKEYLLLTIYPFLN